MEEDMNSEVAETVKETTLGNIYLDSLLCYASTARHSLKNDEIIRICIAFYKEAEIINSKDLLCDLIGLKGKRRRNENRLVNEMKDIMDMLIHCDDNSIRLPKFVADSYNGLPPTSGFEVVANYILKLNEELSNLREEVTELKQIRREEDIYNKDVFLVKEDLIEIKG